MFTESFLRWFHHVPGGDGGEAFEGRGTGGDRASLLSGTEVSHTQKHMLCCLRGHLQL